MKASNLLPFKVRRLGWIILAPALILGIMLMYFEFKIADFEVTAPYKGIFTQVSKNNLTEELVSIIVIISLILIAFSEESEEDEWVSKIRLESFQWSVYANYADSCHPVYLRNAFFEARGYNMDTIIILFILRFNYVLRVKFNPNRIEIHEK